MSLSFIPSSDKAETNAVNEIYSVQSGDTMEAILVRFYGSYSKEIMEVLPKLGIRYSRVVGNTDNFELPKNYLEWKATCHHNHNLLSLGQEFINLHKTQYLYMMYVWGHSYEFDDKGNWDLIEDFCKLVSGKEDIFDGTNQEVLL